MALVQYTDTGRTNMAVNEKDPTQRVAPTHYYPRPLLNPATHRMLNATYQPDRNLAFGSSLHNTEPFYRSLPMKEQDLWWDIARENAGFRRTFDSSESRDVPVNFYCRLPANFGKWPRMKPSHSENSFAWCDSNSSTKPAHERSRMKSAKSLSHGKLMLQRIIDESSPGKSFASFGTGLMKKNRKKVLKRVPLVPPELYDKLLTTKTVGRPHYPGVGEIFVATSLLHYGKNRCREINANRPIQNNAER